MHHYFPSNEKARSWEAHVEVESREWRKHTEYWMHQDKPLITVLYENLMSQPNQELRRLADFLNLDVSDKEIEEAIESCKIERLREASSKRGEDAASFFREGGSGRGMSRYSADEIKFVESELGDLMTHFGYKTPLAAPMNVSFEPTRDRQDSNHRTHCCGIERHPTDLPHKVSAPLAKMPGNVDRTLPLDIPDHLRNRILRRNRDHHVHVIPHQMALLDLALFLPSQTTENFPKVLPKRP